MTSNHASKALALVLVMLHAASAQAAPGRTRAKPPATPPAPQLSLEEIAVMLSSSNQDELLTAIEASAGLGSNDVVPLIHERVRAGLPPKLLEAAMDAMMLLGDPSAGELFAALTRHRRPTVRLRSVEALVALRSTGAADTLAKALSDSSPQVREAAADGLGELGTATHVDKLLLAFDRGVQSAAKALGKLAKDDQIGKVTAYLGRAPLTSLTPAFDALLMRRDLSEAAKLNLVAQLEELGTAEVRGYLEGLGTRLPADTPTRVRRAVDDAVGRIAK